MDLKDESKKDSKMIIEDRKDKIINLYNDIKSEEINTRPDFQRGEVWTSTKKKMLIDTILRKWPIPPIHLVKIDDSTFEVLDGQQRLTAIRDFIENRFSIDGKIQPLDENIIALHGKKYRQLDPDTKREFNSYRFIIYEMMDYSTGEPGEIFHRLNQSVKLTSSEQRNSLYGELRTQTSKFVELMSDYKVDKELLGFTNSRMAYNDLIARVGFLLEKKTLRVNINDKALNDRFRDDYGFDSNVQDKIFYTISFLSKIREKLEFSGYSINLTKASSLNWIYTIAEHSNNIKENESYVIDAFFNLERAKQAIKINEEIDLNIKNFFGFNDANFRELMLIYIERSSSRVMTTTSILIRDIIINLALNKINIPILENTEEKQLKELTNVMLSSDADIKEFIETLSEEWKAENA